MRAVLHVGDFVWRRVAEDQAFWEREVNDLVVGGIAERMLAECEAKRRLVALHSPVHVCTKDESGDWETAWDARWDTPCPTLRVVAAIYADHVDYRREWDA